MNEKYMGFTYRGISSTEYNAFIVNSGDDLRFYNAPSFSNEFAFPQFSNTNYLIGVNKENKEISFRVALNAVTFKEYKQFLNWINIEDSGELNFDYNPSYSYNAKISSIGEAVYHVIQDETCSLDNPKYHIELDLSFTTVGDWAALWSATEPFFEINRMPKFEGFENHLIPAQSYVSGSFNGIIIDGSPIIWNYVGCSGEYIYPITNKGIMLRRAWDSPTLPSYVYSSTIPRGIRSFELDVRKAYAGTSPRFLRIKIQQSGVDIATYEYDNTFFNFIIDGVDNKIVKISETLLDAIEGSFNFRFEVYAPIGEEAFNRQIVIDNLYWVDFNGETFEDLIDNDEDVPFVKEYERQTPELTSLTLVNSHNTINYYRIYFTNGLKVQDEFGATLYQISSSTPGNLYTRFGIVVDNLGNFIPLEVNTGTFGLKSNEEKKLLITVNEGGNFIIYPVSREII